MALLASLFATALLAAPTVPAAPRKAPRRHGPALASWYDDSGATSCGVHYVYGFATLRRLTGIRCGQRVWLYHGRHRVLGRRQDSGPYVWPRRFDFNATLKAALHCGDLCTVYWRRY